MSPFLTLSRASAAVVRMTPDDAPTVVTAPQHATERHVLDPARDAGVPPLAGRGNDLPGLRSGAAARLESS